MARPSKLSEEDKETIRHLHEDIGVPYKDLALEYGVHFNTILRICEPETYAKHLENSRQYQKENRKTISAQNYSKQRRYTIVFVKNEDDEIIKHIDAQENVNQYFRDLINKDMDEKKQNAVQQSSADV